MSKPDLLVPHNEMNPQGGRTLVQTESPRTPIRASLTPDGGVSTLNLSKPGDFARWQKDLKVASLQTGGERQLYTTDTANCRKCILQASPEDAQPQVGERSVQDRIMQPEITVKPGAVDKKGSKKLQVQEVISFKPRVDTKVKVGKGPESDDRWSGPCSEDC